VVAIGLEQVQTAAGPGQAAAVQRQALQQRAQGLGVAVVAVVEQMLVESPQRQWQPFAGLGVGGLLAQGVEHGPLQPGDPLQDQRGMVADLVADERTELRTFAQQTGAGHVVQRAQHALSGGLAAVPWRRFGRRLGVGV